MLLPWIPSQLNADLVGYHSSIPEIAYRFIKLYILKANNVD